MSRLVHLLGSFIFACVSLPLIFAAAITTSFAFSTLLVRFIVVYIELLVALLSSFIRPQPAEYIPWPPLSPQSKKPRSFNSPTHPLASHSTNQRRPRTSTSVSLPATTVTTPTSIKPFPSGTALFSAAGLVPTPGATTPRDYESVGGWRLTSSADDEAEERWAGNMNARLELPALSTPSPTALHGGRAPRRRSLTAGSLRLLGSPDICAKSSRKRGWSGSEGVSPEGYFTPVVSTAGRRRGSIGMTAKLGSNG